MHSFNRTPELFIQQEHPWNIQEKCLGTIISHGLWPSYSSDFKPSAFYLWAAMKENIQIKHIVANLKGSLHSFLKVTSTCEFKEFMRSSEEHSQHLL
jgi:hypothetical protein